MTRLTIQIHEPQHGWRDAATLEFVNATSTRLEYDLDYASAYLGQRDRHALSLRFPVDLAIHAGPIPGFLLDLVPQGEPLKRLLRRHALPDDAPLVQVLAIAPLAPPGNLRVKEPWCSIDEGRATYAHPGFTRADVTQRDRDFIDYMESSGAPIGGTSGAGGGSPKFLLREDHAGRLHADGWLSDEMTRRALLVKLPYTDSENSRMLARVEKLYYDLLRLLPVRTGAAIEIIDDTLFITRFDREQGIGGNLRYHGLESLYSAHGINVHGAHLRHEDNLLLIKEHSTAKDLDALEYLCRDRLNRMLANTDNHGRNTSFLKKEDEVTLSPLYDVTAMRFFTGDFITELTQWAPEHTAVADQVTWTARELELEATTLTAGLHALAQATADLERAMRDVGVPTSVIERSRPAREQVQSELEALR